MLSILVSLLFLSSTLCQQQPCDPRDPNCANTFQVPGNSFSPNMASDIPFATGGGSGFSNAPNTFDTVAVVGFDSGMPSGFDTGRGVAQIPGLNVVGQPFDVQTDFGTVQRGVGIIETRAFDNDESQTIIVDPNFQPRRPMDQGPTNKNVQNFQPKMDKKMDVFPGQMDKKLDMYPGKFDKKMDIFPDNKYQDKLPSNYDKFPVDQYPVDKYPMDKYPVDKYPVDKYPVDKYPVDKYPVDKYPADKYPVDKYPVDKYPVDKYPVDKYSVDKYPVDKYPVDKYPVDKYPVDKYPVDKYPVDKYPLDKNQVDKYPVDKYPIDKYPMDKYPVDKYPADKLPLDKYPVDKYPMDKYPVDKYQPKYDNTLDPGKYDKYQNYEKVPDIYPAKFEKGINTFPAKNDKKAYDNKVDVFPNRYDKNENYPIVDKVMNILPGKFDKMADNYKPVDKYQPKYDQVMPNKYQKGSYDKKYPSKKSYDNSKYRRRYQKKYDYSSKYPRKYDYPEPTRRPVYRRPVVSDPNQDEYIPTQPAITRRRNNRRQRPRRPSRRRSGY